MAKVQAKPDGYHSVTPHLTVRGAHKAIAFYEKAFGATKLYDMAGPGGQVMHAEMKIGDSIVMLADEFPEMGSKSPESIGGSGGSLMLYVEDVDAAFARAVAAGATVEMPLQNMFWGDRYGSLKDPFGHSWALATHIEDVPPEEMAKRQAEFMKSSG